MKATAWILVLLAALWSYGRSVGAVAPAQPEVGGEGVSAEDALQIVSRYAGLAPDTLSDTALQQLAAATGFLFAVPPQDALAGQERLRAALAARCGGCAPNPGSLPTYAFAGVVRPSIDLGAEIAARGAGPAIDPVPPLGAVAGQLRAGGALDPSWLTQPSLSGLVSLEIGRAGRTDAIPLLLAAAATAPTSADRLAALYAAGRLAGGFAALGAWADDPSCAEGVRRARLLIHEEN